MVTNTACPIIKNFYVAKVCSKSFSDDRLQLCFFKPKLPRNAGWSLSADGKAEC